MVSYWWFFVLGSVLVDGFGGMDLVARVGLEECSIVLGVRRVNQRGRSSEVKSSDAGKNGKKREYRDCLSSQLIALTWMRRPRKKTWKDNLEDLGCSMS